MLCFAASTKISCKFSWSFDIQIICNLVLFFSSMARTNSFYFGFTLNLFQIMETRCSLYFVTFVCCPLYKYIVKILMEFRHSDNLQLGPIYGVAHTSYFCFGFKLEYFKLWRAAVPFFL